MCFVRVLLEFLGSGCGLGGGGGDIGVEGLGFFLSLEGVVEELGGGGLALSDGGAGLEEGGVGTSLVVVVVL